MTESIRKAYEPPAADEESTAKPKALHRASVLAGWLLLVQQGVVIGDGVVELLLGWRLWWFTWVPVSVGLAIGIGMVRRGRRYAGLALLWLGLLTTIQLVQLPGRWRGYDPTELLFPAGVVAFFMLLVGKPGRARARFAVALFAFTQLTWIAVRVQRVRALEDFRRSRAAQRSSDYAR